MPVVDTPFIIGVIREKEKELLEDDEYTRIIQAPSPEEAVRALVDTAYGVYLERANSPFQALEDRLHGEYNWLAELLDDERLLEFIALREQALTTAGALLTDSEADVPPTWQAVSDQLQHEDTAQADTQAILLATKNHLLERMDTLARTPLMKQVAEFTRLRLDTDARLRRMAIDAVDEAQPEHPDSENDMPWLPTFISTEAARGIVEMKDATAYEREWDVRLLQMLTPYRFEPVGKDPILAFWIALTIEARTLRLLLSAKLGGLPVDALEALERPLYLRILY